MASTGRLEVRHRLTSDGFDSAPFTAELVSEFSSEQLRVSLEVTNTGTADFSYEEALHTYLAVSDVTRISLLGLDGCGYLDKVDGGEQVQAGPVRFTGETDRLYGHTGDVVVDDPDWSRKIVVSKEGSAITVVWNPGARPGWVAGRCGPVLVGVRVRRGREYRRPDGDHPSWWDAHACTDAAAALTTSDPDVSKPTGAK